MQTVYFSVSVWVCAHVCVWNKLLLFTFLTRKNCAISLLQFRFDFFTHLHTYIHTHTHAPASYFDCRCESLPSISASLHQLAHSIATKICLFTNGSSGKREMGGSGRTMSSCEFVCVSSMSALNQQMRNMKFMKSVCCWRQLLCNNQINPKSFAGISYTYVHIHIFTAASRYNNFTHVNLYKYIPTGSVPVNR